jgi:lipoate-protein ligase A
MTAGQVDGKAAAWDANAAEEQAWILQSLRERVRHPEIRAWIYRSPSVVLGCSQRADAGMLERAAAQGVELCVRPSGGGAVLAGSWMLGASVLLPPEHPLIVPGIAPSFRWFGEAHARWLNDLGMGARCAPSPEVGSGRHMSWACFGSLSHWELQAGGGKIVGLSQARKRNGVLLSSGVLVGPSPWGLLCEVMGTGSGYAAILARRTTSCEQLLGVPVNREFVAGSLLAALQEGLSAGGSPAMISGPPCAASPARGG